MEPEANRVELQQTELSIDTAVGALYGLQLHAWLDVLAPALTQLPPSQRPRWFVPSDSGTQPFDGGLALQGNLAPL